MIYKFNDPRNTYKPTEVAKEGKSGESIDVSTDRAKDAGGKLGAIIDYATGTTKHFDIQTGKPM
jgi:hypothetical protein